MSPKNAAAADEPANLPKITDLLKETGISGSILLLSNEVEQVEGLTVTNKDGIGNTGDGFQYGIFDIVFEPEEDYKSIVESFLHWLKRSAEEEQSWFRSAHIGTFRHWYLTPLRQM